MKKLAVYILFISVNILACKKPEVIEKTDECKPKEPIVYFEAKEMTAIVGGIHQFSGRIRVGLIDTSQFSNQLKLHYPKLIREMSVYSFCPCNLPLQYEKEGQKFKISGISRIERSSLEFYQNLVENPTNQPHDSDDCLPFETTKIEAIQ